MEVNKNIFNNTQNNQDSQSNTGETEISNDTSNLHIIGSESDPAAIERLNVGSEVDPAEISKDVVSTNISSTNVSTADGSNVDSTSIPAATTTITTNSGSEAMCNGHLSRESAMDSEYVNGGGKEQISEIETKDSKSPVGAPLENNVIVGASESHEKETIDNKTEGKMPALVNSVSVESYEPDTEDMQTEGGNEEMGRRKHY